MEDLRYHHRPGEAPLGLFCKIKNCTKRGFALGKATNAQTSLRREGRPDIALYNAISKSHRTRPSKTTLLRAGSSHVFRYDRDFHSMIFGGEIIKIRHGVGCVQWPFSEVSEVVMWLFLALAGNLSP